MSKPKKYLFLLGSHLDLSVSEVSLYGTINTLDQKEALALCSDLRFSNPRSLPKSKEQLLLDQLGGTIRFGEVLGTFQDWDALVEAFLSEIPEPKQTPKFRVGVTTFGASKNPMRDEFLDLVRTKRPDVRLSNPPKSNMTSARVFDERLIQKGVELLIWFRGDDYILAKTVATQNIRNYTIRDRHKGFRDAHMGMMPPKLVQMMLNLAESTDTKVVIDPFCGSGTTNIEAALKGYETVGSDLDQHRSDQSVQNFSEMSERFRFEESLSLFLCSDAAQFPLQKLQKVSSVMVTEGYLGKNFRKKPTPAEVQDQARYVTELWGKVFAHWHESPVDTIVFTLPSWQVGSKPVSIAKKVLGLAEKHGWMVDPVISDEKPTYVYARPGAFVAREVCRVRKK